MATHVGQTSRGPDRGPKPGRRGPANARKTVVAPGTAERGQGLRFVPCEPLAVDDEPADPQALRVLALILERLAALAQVSHLEGWGDEADMYLGANDAGLADVHADLSIVHGRLMVRISRPYS